MNKKMTFALLIGAAAATPYPVLSAPITLTLSDSAVQVTYGGVQQIVDLTVVGVADTANFSKTLGAGGASSGYGNLSLKFTSVALGLAGVTGSELWDFTWAFAGFQDSVILFDAGGNDGTGTSGFGLLSWDGVSSIGPLGPSQFGSSFNAGNPTDVIGGIAFQINNFGRLTSFTAVVTQVPEPGTLALLGLGLSGVAAMRRRKKN